MNDNINKTPRLYSRQSERESSSNSPRRNNNNNRSGNRRNNHSRSRKKSMSTFKLGQIFSVTYNLALLAFVFYLVRNGKDDLALKIFSINAALIAFGILVTFVERNFVKKNKGRNSQGQRRRPNNNNQRRR